MNKNEITKKRIVWIDYARAIGIYLVIFAHFPHKEPLLNGYFSTFRMPLFFILSGFFELGNLKVCESFRNGIKKLLIPYISFYIITYLIWLLYHLFYLPKVVDYKIILLKPLLGFLLGYGYETNYSTAINGPLWFFWALFWIKLLFALLVNIIKQKNYKKLSVFVLISIVIVFIINLFGVKNVFSIECAILAFPFYCFGYYLHKYNTIELLFQFRLRYIIIIFFIAISIITFILNGRINISNLYFGKNVLLFYISGVSGPLYLILFLRSLPQRRIKFVEYISRGTITIVGLNLLIINFIDKLNINNYEYFDYQSLFLSIVVLIILLFPIGLIERRFPFLIGRNKKNENEFL